MLEDFVGSIMLTDTEKKCRLGQLDLDKEDGHVDEQCVPFLDRLNALHGVVSTECCWGHGPDDDRRPHLDIRFGYEFGQLFCLVQPYMEAFDGDVRVLGWEVMMPRFCFWMSDETWSNEFGCLVACFERALKREHA